MSATAFTTHPDLHTPRLLLRAPRPTDLWPLAAILLEPAVARFWPGYDEQRVAAELLAADADKVVLVLADRERPDQAIGVIQYTQEHDLQYRHAGIDLCLSTAWHRRGLGQEAIRAVLSHLFGVLGHHRVTIDPSADNERALRAYERVGFRRVGLLRQYERRPDGLHDGVLMELLAQDYRSDSGREARSAAVLGREARSAAVLGREARTTECVLRPATTADLPLLLDMMGDFNRGEHIDWDPVSGVAPLRHLLSDPALGLVMLICTAGPPLGYAVATYGYDLEFAGRDAFLTELYLAPGARDQGLGRRALEQLFHYLRGQGALALHLQVRPDNVAAQRLYLSAGFVGTTRHFMTRLLPDRRGPAVGSRG